jgi:uncharacterized membrane protein YidH (DUF202 family)
VTGPPAVAAERTRLAWRRTSLSALAVPLLAGAKVVIASPTTPRLLGVAAMTVAWLGIAAVAHPRMQSLRRGSPVAAMRTPALVALWVTAFAMLGTLLIA